MSGGTMTAANLVLNGNSGPASFKQTGGIVDIRRITTISTTTACMSATAAKGPTP